MAGFAIRATESLRHMLIRHRRLLQVLLLGLMVLAAAGGAWRFVHGRLWEDPGRLTMGLYVMPMYLIVFWWAIVMLNQPDTLHVRGLLADALAVAVAGSRCVVWLGPFSGHVVFLLYSLLVTRSLAYRVGAGVALVLSLGTKFYLWNDFLTPFTGAAIALGLWRLRGGCRTGSTPAG